VFRRIETILSRVEDFCGALAAIGMAAIMLIVASDVGLRYLVGRPWSWAYDVVSIYLTISIFYLALSRTFREHGHISVDLVERYMSPRVRHCFGLFICILSATLFVLIAWITTRLTWSQYAAEDVISSVVDWPTWLSTIFVPIGTILVVVRLVLTAISHISFLASGEELIRTPPSADATRSVSTGE
jgi:TRAP-type C4-dicarboxylate transport system permease small subunit